MIKTYSELLQLSTFDERFNYLKLNGVIGIDTFGFDRYLNQKLYSSSEWKNLRKRIIIRDNGCDLGVKGCDILGKILIHHLNPITIDDIKNRSPTIFDPNNLICVSHDTHNAIHYSNENLLNKVPNERKLNDTCPWKH